MQLSQVNNERGAPMGRTGRDIKNAGPVKMRLEVVALDSGGYDKGGAYWGLRMPVTRRVACRPIGHPVDAPPVMRDIRQTPRIYRYYWCGNFRKTPKPIIEGFVEAFDRDDAKAQVRAMYSDATFYK